MILRCRFCLLALASLFFVLAGSSFVSAEAPEIQYLYPQGGMAGIMGEISGSNFDPIAANNEIHFVTETLDYSIVPDYYVDFGWSETLGFTIPGSIAPGKYDVFVQIGDITSTYQYDQPTFTVSGPPHHIDSQGSDTSFNSTYQGESFYYSGAVVDEQGRYTGQYPMLQSTDTSVAIATSDYQFVSVGNGSATIQASYPGVPSVNLPITVNIPGTAPYISSLNTVPSAISVTDITQTITVSAVVENYPNRGYGISVSAPMFATNVSNFDSNLIDLGGGTYQITYSMEMPEGPGLGMYSGNLYANGGGGISGARRWFFIDSTSPNDRPWINGLETFNDFQPGTVVDVIGGNFAPIPSDNEIFFYGSEGTTSAICFRNDPHFGLGAIIPENTTSGELTVVTGGKESNRVPYEVIAPGTPTPTDTAFATPTPTDTDTPTETDTPTSTPTAVPGDFSGDGQVDVRDMTQIMASFGIEDATYSLNDDGVVDYLDIFLMSLYWQSK